MSARSRFGDSRPEQLSHQRYRERAIEREVHRGLRLAVAFEIVCERRQRRSAEWVERSALRGRGEATDDLSIEPERREPVADALFRLRNDRADRLAQLLKRRAVLR